MHSTPLEGCAFPARKACWVGQGDSNRDASRWRPACFPWRFWVDWLGGGRPPSLAGERLPLFPSRFVYEFMPLQPAGPASECPGSVAFLSFLQPILLFRILLPLVLWERFAGVRTVANAIWWGSSKPPLFPPPWSLNLLIYPFFLILALFLFFVKIFSIPGRL